MSIKTILRTVIASGLVVGTAAALSPAAFAAQDSGNQSGSITAIATVDYTPASSFTITPNSTMTDQSFGSVNVQSNSNSGWVLQVASTNGSILKHATITTASIAYTLKVDGTPVDVSTPATDVEAKNVTTLTAAGAGGANYPVVGTIAGTDSNGKPSGTYSDTLTFTLTNQ